MSSMVGLSNVLCYNTGTRGQSKGMLGCAVADRDKPIDVAPLMMAP
ncbi:MAG: hypothetical protein IPI42_06750 [Saprospiraceae bacterium]|nr:hypothetical protein [Candidatus Parvibacillus calidus]